MSLTPMTVRRFLVDVLPALVYLAALFYGGSIPLKMPSVDVGLSIDKVLHVLAFGGLQVLLFRTLRYEVGLSNARKNWIAVAGASGLGLLLELYQATLPHRSAELWDWIADTIGAVLAAGLLSLGGRRFLAPSPEPPPAAEPR